MEEIELRVAIYERLGLEFGSLPSESGNDWQRAKDEVLEENRQIEFEKLQQLKKIDYAKVDKESDEYKTVMNSKSLQMQVFHITISSRSDLLNDDINNILVPENNEAMTGSYLLIDPRGKLFENSKGKHTYSRSLVDNSVEDCLKDIELDREMFIKRGGIYKW